MGKIYLVWKEGHETYDFELKCFEYDDGDYGTQQRDNYYENLKTIEGSEILTGSIKYQDENPCRYHAHYLNSLIEEKVDPEEDPRTWEHCTECHADDYHHYGINGPNCGHWAGCPNC